ncbi:gliding motility-associated C-terminal domain-containing protein, partial [Tenacibaculum sp. 1B UA]|uniref:gliding motility-associated C-terminal domain-containing protein n=1 Tax=Tenacibaculum sp. 1B UA TaxID=2922252 RepID=UPI002A23ABD8
TAPTLSAEPTDISVDCEAIPSVPTITATDNCDSVVDVIFTEVSNTVVDGCGEIVRQWESTDNCGNTVSHSQTITVADITKPGFTVPADITIFKDDTCTYDANVGITGDVIDESDNCDTNLSASYTDIESVGSCEGEIIVTRTWSLTDNCGNTTEKDQRITVKDNIAPVIDETNKDNIDIECGVGDTETTLQDWLDSNAGATATDNCSSVTWTNNYGDDTSVKCDGSYIIVTFTATDVCGNSSITTAGYLIKDETAPTITQQPSDKAVECDGSGNTAELNAWLASNGGATATDDCSVVSWSNNYTDLTYICSFTGEVEVIFTAKDACGNPVDTNSAKFIIEDTQAPEFVEELPVDVTVSCDTIPAAMVLTATDNCDASVTVNYSEEFSGQDDECASEYTITRTWTVQDCAGNTTSHAQEVTVEDTTAPEFVEELPVDVTVSCDTIPVAMVLTATDNCDTSVTVNYSEEFAGQDDECASEYTITRTWTVEDCAGNTTSHTQEVTVEDTAAPEFVEELPVDVTVSCDTIPAAMVLTATDNCDASVTVNYSEEFSGQDDECASEYTITRTWTVQDCAGNTTSHAQEVTVEDTTAPEFVEELPADVTVSCDAIPAAAVLTATDNCDTSVTVNYSEEFSGQDDECASEYTITRTWTVQDCAGNTTSHTQEVTVEDTTAPEFVETLPTNTTVSCDAIPAVAVLTATDNCDSEVIVVYSEELSGQEEGCASEYIITRKWEVQDCAGNTTSHTQVITIEDNEVPTLVSTLEDITVECDTVPEVPTLEFTDNCSSNVTQTNFEETSTFEGSDSDYTITRTWTVADDCGNTAEFTQYITVTVKTSVTEVADSRCIDDGEIDLNDYLANQSEDGTWEVTQGSVTVSDDGSFDPSGVNLGDYIFTYTSANNGCLTSTKVTININDDCIVLPCGQEDVVISKAVTPNGDSWNEFFEVTGVESCGFIANVKIFNRWGARVFESNNYANNWNGVSDGATFGSAERLPAGTYYYIVILENSGLKPFTGAIYLGTK